jgi:hypothetical protein
MLWGWLNAESVPGNHTDIEIRFFINMRLLSRQKLFYGAQLKHYKTKTGRAVLIPCLLKVIVGVDS